MKTLLPVKFMTVVGFLVIGLVFSVDGFGQQTATTAPNTGPQDNNPYNVLVTECMRKAMDSNKGPDAICQNLIDRSNAYQKDNSGKPGACDTTNVDNANTKYQEACSNLGNSTSSSAKPNESGGDDCKSKFVACKNALTQDFSCGDADASTDDDEDSPYPQACGGPSKDDLKDLQSAVKELKDDKKDATSRVHELQDSINKDDQKEIASLQKARVDALDQLVQQQTKMVNELTNLSNKMKADAVARTEQARQAYLKMDAGYVSLKDAYNKAQEDATTEANNQSSNCAAQAQTLFAQWMKTRDRARQGLSGVSVSTAVQKAKLNELYNLCMGLRTTQAALQAKNQNFYMPKNHLKHKELVFKKAIMKHY